MPNTGPRFIHCGFDNVIRSDAILAIVSPAAACAKRQVRKAKEDGTYIDLCLGHTTRSILITDGGLIIGCGISPRTLQQRMNGYDDDADNKFKDGDETYL